MVTSMSIQQILKATLSGLPDRVFMKLVVSTKTDQVVGLHMCVEDSAEVAHGFAVAIKAGLTKAQFDSTIGVHPTSAEEFVTMRTPTRKKSETLHLGLSQGSMHGVYILDNQRCRSKGAC